MDLNTVRNKKGFLIAFEGIDGAGKRTWLNVLNKFLIKNDFLVKTFDYPNYKSPWGRIIKDYLYNKIELDYTIQFFTYFTDILKDQNDINTYLSNKYTVLLNRYFTSTIAFQCAKGFPYDKALNIVKLVNPLIPNVIFYLDVFPETAIERCYNRRSPDRHERDLSLLRKVRDTYKRMKKDKVLTQNWITIDTNEDFTSTKTMLIDTIKSIYGL